MIFPVSKNSEDVSLYLTHPIWSPLQLLCKRLLEKRLNLHLSMHLKALFGETFARHFTTAFCTKSPETFSTWICLLGSPFAGMPPPRQAPGKCAVLRFTFCEWNVANLATISCKPLLLR
jgi:hypothetical protein